MKLGKKTSFLWGKLLTHEKQVLLVHFFESRCVCRQTRGDVRGLRPQPTWPPKHRDDIFLPETSHNISATGSQETLRKVAAWGNEVQLLPHLSSHGMSSKNICGQSGHGKQMNQ